MKPHIFVSLNGYDCARCALPQRNRVHSEIAATADQPLPLTG